LAVLFLVLFCSAVASAAATTATCPSGCSCLQPTVAREKGYDACGGQLSACGYDAYQKTMYCYKTPPLSIPLRTLQTLVIATTTTQSGACAVGCSCMMESDAKEKFGTYSRCSDTPCYSVTTGSTTLNAYCFRQGITSTTTPVPSCPEGCTCLSDAQAKERYGTFTRCSETVCGYDIPTNVVAAYQIPKYCVKQGSTTPVCPEGCSCISEATAKAKGGSWSRCSADVCGYEQSTATLAAVVQVPKYCMKQTETIPVCPEGCACVSEDDAKLKGLTERCDNSQTPCGYKSAATTANQGIPLYCYKLPTSTSSCPDGCSCLSEEKAKERYGTFTRCTEEICGKETVQPVTGAAPYSVPQYCVKQGTTPVCPQGCYCLQEAEAKLKFGPDNYTRCQADVCGYDPSATTANGIPRYCFKPTVIPASLACPQGCYCVHEVDMKNRYGPNNYTQCQKEPCLFDVAVGEPAYCFRPMVTPVSPSCSYDYQKNVCTGTCQQGYTCGLSASKKDATGKVVYAACGCTGQAATPCTYDAQKNACTGSCQTGTACAVVGRNVDEKTGATTPVCGCPPQSSCSYSYDKESCAGTCTLTGENCQLNTIYRDPTTGKVTYADCQCKGGGDTTSTCSCDAATGSCSGTCAGGKACTMTERTTDNAGKVVCKSCGCEDTCVLTANNECSGTCVTGAPCARIVTKDESGQEKVSCGCGGTQTGVPVKVASPPQGFFEAIGSFFNKLFGGK
jgi:hypothetical protein